MIYGFHLLLSLFTRLQSSVNVSPLTVADKLKYIEDCQLTTDQLSVVLKRYVK